MLEANYGMASPHGYRTAMRLMQVNYFAVLKCNVLYWNVLLWISCRYCSVLYSTETKIGNRNWYTSAFKISLSLFLPLWHTHSLSLSNKRWLSSSSLSLSIQMAERFGLPVITLVDTVGAWPTFECERDGQSEVQYLCQCIHHRYALIGISTYSYSTYIIDLLGISFSAYFLLKIALAVIIDSDCHYCCCCCCCCCYYCWALFSILAFF